MVAEAAEAAAMIVAAIIQARYGATRLPGKVLADVEGQTVLALVVDLAKMIPGVDALYVATSMAAKDDAVAAEAKRVGANVFRGPELDVLARYLGAARKAEADVIVRITCDCPLLDPTIAGLVLKRFRDARAMIGPLNVQWASNVHPTRTYPDGLDVEVVDRETLERAGKEARGAEDREHVMPWIYRKTFGVSLEFDIDLSAVRWTVDTPEDLERVRAIVRGLPKPIPYDLSETLAVHVALAEEAKTG
jgi:spore coat polysaccharide biosynthesis protein SpsF